MHGGVHESFYRVLMANTLFFELFLPQVMLLDVGVFLGNGVKPIKSRQILLSGDMTGDEFVAKWALQRV